MKLIGSRKTLRPFCRFKRISEPLADKAIQEVNPRIVSSPNRLSFCTNRTNTLQSPSRVPRTRPSVQQGNQRCHEVRVLLSGAA